MALSQKWDASFSLTEDHSVPEYFQYLKFLCTLFLIFYLFLRKRNIGYIAWFLFFALLLSDDALQLHERYGALLANNLDLQPYLGLRPVDFGEMLYAIIAGIILFPFLAISYYKGSNEFRQVSIDIALLVGVLLFFGILVDAVHSMLSDVNYVSGFLVLIEDGGEMVAMSLIVWYFYFLISTQAKRNSFYVRPLFLSKLQTLVLYFVDR